MSKKKVQKQERSREKLAKAIYEAFFEPEDNGASKYYHYHVPYRLVGRVPEEARDKFSALFLALGSEFSTSGLSCNGSEISGSLRLELLRDRSSYPDIPDIPDFKKIIELFSSAFNTPWLVDALLKREPCDTHFVFSPEGEFYAVRW